GDRKYGSQSDWPSGIALHSYRLTIEHPTKRELMTFQCPPPPSWNHIRSKAWTSGLSDLSWE
ncbi:MAG: RluA family pseudouridine synthase, partial [Rhodopirellula sp. JB053]